MPADLSPIDKAKFVAARRAVAYVENGMKLGLGTGSTAAWMVRCLAERIRDEGIRVVGVPTSTRTAELARQLGVPVASLDEVKWLDLTIDGADEVDQGLNLIKGGGAAHLQEKIVAGASDRMVVITDPSKEVAQLGAFPLPVEITPFGAGVTRARIEAVIAAAPVARRDTRLRMAGDRPLVTDEGNLIVDLMLDRIDAPEALDAALLGNPRRGRDRPVPGHLRHRGDRPSRRPGRAAPQGRRPRDQRHRPLGRRHTAGGLTVQKGFP